MTSTPRDESPHDENPNPEEQESGAATSGSGVEIGLGEPSTFEPEEDPEAAD